MKLIGKILSFILMALFIITMYLVYRLNVLPLKYFLIVGIVLLLVIFILCFKLIRKKTKFFSRIFFSVVAIIFIGVIYYILTYINATYDFMNSMVLNNFETITYDVVIPNSSNIEKVKELKNSSISYLESDSNYSKAKLLLRKDINYQENSCKNINGIISSFENSKALFIEDSYYNLLKEEYDFVKDTKVIKTYKLIVKKDKKTNSSTTSKPFIIYISGIDTYGKISSVSRSDVNIVAVVNPALEKILLVSIPRDYYVKLHNTNGYNDKLTHAGIYGIDMSVNTIEDLLDINIDYYLRLNFSTLTKSIDLLDGVDVYSDITFNPTTNPSLTIYQGLNHMNGEEALAFARERYAYKTGDRHRGENQQAIIEAVIKKLSNPKNITKYKDILNSLDGTFETDMSYKDITNLVKLQISKNIDWNVTSISLDGKGSMMPTYSMGERKLYVMIPDEETVVNAKNKISKYMESK